jgi:ABC-type branched-subunit amino acid transport system substrate-binding protein
MHARKRFAAALVVAGLVSAACGARLSPAQRNQALSQGGGKADTVLTGGSTGNVVGPGGSTGTGTTGTTGTTTGTAGTTGTTGATGSTGTGTTGTTGQQISGPQTSADWTKAPAGGNGGATDVGVTADKIVVANISDVSGAVPGLFEDARFAVQAYFKYFAARYGTIYGRKIVVEALDSQLDSGANRSASIQACSETFAGVGSVSAFDQGGAPVIKDCKSKGGYYPDIRGLATTDQMKAVPNAYPADVAGVGGTRSLGQYGWAAEKFPNAVKKAAYVYSDGEVTRQLEQQDVEGTKAVLGYNWVAEIPVGTTETNYGPAAQQIKSAGAQYVTFVGAYQQAASLARSMSNLGWKPQVYSPTVTAYTPNFIQQAGDALNGDYVFIGSTGALNEEINLNPELQLYAQWLQQVKPGATPTNIGSFAWGAAALFVQQMIKVGPQPTRGKLLSLLPNVHSFGANGLYPGQDVGGRVLGDCVAVVQVKGNKFVRFLPSAPGTYRCGKDGLWNTKTNKAEKASQPAAKEPPAP